MRANSVPFRLPCAMAVLAALIGLSGCASERAATADEGRAIRVVVRDFRVSAPKRVPAGTVELRGHNRGPDTHELVLVRADDGALPLRRDGTTVDEDALEDDEVGEIEDLEPGHSETLRAHLKPGRYLLFCNMSGHYLGGMHRRLVVQ